MKKKNMATIVMTMALATSLMVGCGTPSPSPVASVAPAASAAPTASAAPEASAAPSASTGRQTSATNKVVTIGTLPTNLSGPIFVTSVGQSADVSMLDALLKKVGIEYTYNPTLKAADMAGAKTILISAGASSKGLGAAGISADDEKARAKELLQYCADNNVTVILTHLGGQARRGTLSDEFSQLVLDQSSAILMVEDGNADNKFTDFAAEKKIPITLVNSIADCIAPLKTMFGK